MNRIVQNVLRNSASLDTPQMGDVKMYWQKERPEQVSQSESELFTGNKSK